MLSRIARRNLISMSRETLKSRWRSRLGRSLCAPLLTVVALAHAPSLPRLHRSLAALPQDTGRAGLGETIRKLQTTGRFMMVTAHPDDEDGPLLTLEARGRGVRTLLFTLTRGEGGQNKTGGTFSDELGILRTLELLAADRYYQVEQRFSRVADFGYSKTAEETFEKWGGHDLALADMVHVIREFRPDVLVARFSGTDRDGHGHHQASAILTREAFRASSDPHRFPEQMAAGLRPWQPKKLYIGNVCGFGATSCADENWTVKLNTGEDDPLLGMSYAQMAIEGLRHQQSQGLGDLKVSPGPRYAFYKLVDSVLPKTTDANGHEKDFFDGIDTSLTGLAARLGGEQSKVPWSPQELEALAKAVATLNRESQNPSEAQISQLVEVLAQLKRLRQKVDGATALSMVSRADVADRLLAAQALTERALKLALNISASETTELVPARDPNEHAAAIAAVSPGQKLEEHFTVHNGSSDRLRMNLAVGKPPIESAPAASALLEPGENYSHEFQFSLPDRLCCTRPYWHREDPQRDSIYTIDQPEFATLPFPPFPLKAELHYSVVESSRESAADPTPGALLSIPILAPRDPQARQELELGVVPAFSVSVEPSDLVVRTQAGSVPDVRVRISSNLDVAPPGTLKLAAPPGWTVDPRAQPVALRAGDREQVFTFKVKPAKLAQQKVTLRATLAAGNKTFSEGYSLVTREDLGSFYYFHPAVEHLSAVDLEIPNHLKLGYIMGAGDDIPTVLAQLGIDVTMIPAEALAERDLASFQTIVLGVRAYDTRKELATENAKLLDFVRRGGTLIVQNNNSVSDFNGGHYTPYPAELGRARVSREEAPVEMLAPQDAIFHYPNQISEKDFDDWVQERGLYFMSKWDDHFRPLLACHDPNEADQKGGLLVANYGQGTYIYTGYAFFRQLPAGVPGAIRLFVNLVSAGQSGHRPGS